MIHLKAARDAFFVLRLLALFAVLLRGSGALAAPASIKLPGNSVFPESLSSSNDGTLYVGAFATGGVLRIRPGGKPTQWIKPGAFGSASILGVLVDEPSNTLWVCSNDLSSGGFKVPGAAPGSALIGFNLKTGAGKARIAFAGDYNFCNDMVIGSDGSVYVTNSFAPEILRLPPGGKTLQVWFSEPTLKPEPNGYGLDGIAFGVDGDLYINRFDAADLYRIKVENGKAGKLTRLHESRKLTQTDALRMLRPGVFLLIEGGGRLDTMTVKGDDATITTLQDGYSTPTGVAIVGNIAWVSEGQMEFLPDPTKPDLKPRLPFKVFAVPLPK